MGELDNHLRVKSGEGPCQFTEISCPEKCGENVKRCDLEKHKSEECANRPFTCKYCKFETTYKNRESHWLSCPIKCPSKCSATFEHKDLEHHLVEECPLHENECKFVFPACKVKLKRKAMQEHLDAHKDEHLE